MGVPKYTKMYQNGKQQTYGELLHFTEIISGCRTVTSGFPKFGIGSDWIVRMKRRTAYKCIIHWILSPG